MLACAPVAQAATWVSYPTILHQLRTGPLIRVIVNRPLDHVEIKFANLDEWEAVYPPTAEATVQRLTERRHIHLIFASKRPGPGAARPAAVHHKVRYVTSAVLLALLATGAAWWWLAQRRRRSATHAPAASSGEGGGQDQPGQA